MRLGRHLWLPVLALCGGCVSTNPYYIDPTGESDTSTATGDDDSTVGESATTGVDPTTADVTSTTAPGTTTSAVTDTVTDSETDTDDTGMPEAYCGDGQMNPGEGCDDGNAVDDDGCTNLCTLPACGDGLLNQDSETCDEGDLNSDNAWCTLECLPNICGDGKLGPEEDCDDGNGNSGDGCSAQCALEACGNGVLDAGEFCDDGNDDDLDLCTTLCVPPAQLVEFVEGGLSNVLGKPDGDVTGVICDGVLTGIDGTFGNDVVAQIGTTCSDVKLEPGDPGTYRLVPTGPELYSDELIGLAPDMPEPFAKKCPSDSPFLQDLGGKGTEEGLTQLGLQCVNLRVKPAEGTYKITPENPQFFGLGKADGMILMPASCAEIPSSIITEVVAIAGGDYIVGLSFECEIPVFNEW